ncbi:MAG: glycosyl hydrolase family 18 protein [Ignavibacterium sp.]|nr:glycosyl hydrolase family 18 protein [Ignavibacterium sp.]
MNKKLFILLLIINSIAISQTNYKSIHQIENEFYQKNPELVGRDFIPKGYTKRDDLNKPTILSKVVYGFHPYWISDATASNYYYSLLTHIAYFSAEVDNSTSTTGGFTTTRNWATTQVVNYAKNFGVKIHLCVTMFSNHDRVLNNSTYRQNLINNIITQINLRNADGCNIDFESISSSQAINFRTFIYDLGTALKSLGKELVVELPAVDWNNVFTTDFFNQVNSVVDYYFLMAYDYWWSGSSTAGPVSPLTTGTSIHHVTRSINTYLSRGATKQRLISGFPYYGYDWPVTSSTRMASTTGTGTARTYSTIRPIVDTLPSPNKFSSDATYNVPWYRYTTSSQWRQVWYDDSLSLSKKYDSVKTIGIAGTGMWALGYDGSYTDLWGALKEAFASKSIAYHTILDDFEWSVGRFDKQPTYSGSTIGVSKLSSSERTTGVAYNGAGSLKIVLKDSVSQSANWFVRLLSGNGNPSNNIPLNSSGYLGFYMKTNTAPSNAKVAITIDDNLGQTEISPYLDVINNGEWNLYQWNLQSTGWSSFAGGNGVINGPSITLDAIIFSAPNNSSDWTIFIDDVSYYAHGPLPVELVFFDAVYFDGKVKLTWKTASELENYGWEIEKAVKSSTNPILKEWNTIGFVNGSGNSNSPKEYHFIDNDVQYGEVYYRLKQIDYDGSIEYSNPIRLYINYKPPIVSLNAFPNPFNSNTTIRFELPKQGFVKLEVYDILGRKIKSLVNKFFKEGIYEMNLNGDDLSSGIYILYLKIDENAVIHKIQLIK